MQFIDWIVLGGYLGAVALLGVWFAGRQKDAEGYFVGGRKMPWWAVGLSLSAQPSAQGRSSPCRARDTGVTGPTFPRTS